MKAGLSDVLLFCDSFLVFVPEYFSTVLLQFLPMKRVFFNSPTQFHLKAGLSDVLPFPFVWS
jgi:hypothetical protein